MQSALAPHSNLTLRRNAIDILYTNGEIVVFVISIIDDFHVDLHVVACIASCGFS